MKRLRVLVGHVDYPSPYLNVGQDARNYFQRLRDAGFDVEGFCLTLNPPGPGLPFAELDARWRRGDRELLAMYERLEERLSDKDVFINESGINLHPQFVEKLSVFAVFQCFDDIDGLNDNLTKRVAHAYDLCLTGNIAEVDTYRKWGLANVEWTPLGLRSDIYDRTMTYEDILTGHRDIDLFMLIDRVSPWGNRTQRLDQLAAAFPDAHFYGNGWPRGYLPEAHQLSFLRRAKIGPNIHLGTGPLNYRTYYLPANGVLQICDNKSHLGKVYELGKEVVGFDTIEECVDLCRYYLAHDDECRKIAAQGWKRAVTDYNEVAVYSRTVEIIKEHMPHWPPKPVFVHIAAQRRQKTVVRRFRYNIFGRPLQFLGKFLSRLPGFGKVFRHLLNTRNAMRLAFYLGPSASHGHFKLHLGCGAERLPGYINIDSDPKAVADLYLDFRYLRRVFKPESVSEVMVIHSLSYLNLWEARDLFEELYKLMEPGGKLIIELPDITKCARKVLEAGESTADYLEGVRGIYAFGMDQIARQEVYRPYVFGWSGWHLKEELERVGFKGVTLLEPQTHGPSLWRDVRIEARK